MTWKQFFTSSIGKKFMMGATGFFLITFLIVHAGINAMIFFNDNGETFNHWAHFMGSNLIVRTLEIGLMAFLLLHIYQGLSLWRQNHNARPIKYAVTKGDGKSKWYSKTMGLLGTLILIFLIMHFYHFWIPSRFGGMASIQPLAETTLGQEYNNQPVHNLYQEMLTVFNGNSYALIIIIFYVLGCFSLCWHLLHGFQSAFQTFGIHHKRYTPLIKTIGVVYSVGISLLFASMPISMYLGFVK
jgi:succinate dehydrogenase / fumarate reductase, cytochrome b subunit